MEFTSIKDLLGSDNKLSPINMKSAIRLSIASEEDATSLYEQIARATDDPQIKKLMIDIANQQKVHAGQFKKLLNDRDPNNITKQKQGYRQARQKIDRNNRLIECVICAVYNIRMVNKNQETI